MLEIIDDPCAWITAPESALSKALVLLYGKSTAITPVNINAATNFQAKTGFRKIVGDRAGPVTVHFPQSQVLPLYVDGTGIMAELAVTADGLLRVTNLLGGSLTWIASFMNKGVSGRSQYNDINYSVFGTNTSSMFFYIYTSTYSGGGGFLIYGMSHATTMLTQLDRNYHQLSGRTMLHVIGHAVAEVSSFDFVFTPKIEWVLGYVNNKLSVIRDGEMFEPTDEVFLPLWHIWYVTSGDAPTIRSGYLV